jgi:hypothetical protein
VPRKLRTTLTLNTLKSVHTLNYSILLSESYIVTTPEYSGPLILKNYICVVALAPGLRAATFYDIREFFDYSSTIKLLLLLIFINESYSILKALLLSRKSLLALWLL